MTGIASTEMVPNPNEKVEIVHHGQVAVGDGMLVLQIFNEEFIRGGIGKVWFSLENTGDEAIEIVTARNSGNADSDQIRFTVKDEDGNVIAAKVFRQGVGENIVTLADKTGVARIDAGHFSHSYTPAAGEAGIFTVRVVHPDLTDKPVQGQFVISRVAVSPTTVNLNIPKNYDQKISVKVSPSPGTDLNHLTLGDPLALLAGGQSADQAFHLWADNTAAATAIHETQVPAAVVGIAPASITLPAMQAGDVYNGEITLTNYGLIRADDAHFDFEFSSSLPASIGAQQQVTIPYRVTCLSPLEPESDGTGGGCGTTSSGSNVFVHDVYRIIKSDDGACREDNAGHWKTDDENGRMNCKADAAGRPTFIAYNCFGICPGLCPERR